jgi:cell division protein FtsB
MKHQLVEKSRETARLHAEIKALRNRVDNVDSAKKELITKYGRYRQENVELKRHIKTVN